MSTLNPDIMHIYIIPKLVKNVDLIVFITLRLVSSDVKYEIERHCHEKYKAISLSNLSKADEMMIIRGRGCLALKDDSSRVICLSYFISTSDYILSLSDEDIVWRFQMFRILIGAGPKKLITFSVIIDDLIRKTYDIDALAKWICPDFFLLLLDKSSAFVNIYDDVTNLVILVKRLGLCERLKSLIIERIQDNKPVNFIYLIWWYSVHDDKDRYYARIKSLYNNGREIESGKESGSYMDLLGQINYSDPEDIDMFALYLSQTYEIYSDI